MTTEMIVIRTLIAGSHTYKPNPLVLFFRYDFLLRVLWNVMIKTVAHYMKSILCVISDNKSVEMQKKVE